MQASVVVIKCAKAKRMFGVRVQKMSDGDWWRTWAFKINEKKAQNEGYVSNAIQGSLNKTEEYPGCPYCGSYDFVQCGKCKKLTCYRGEAALTCLWCGKYMDNIAPAEEKFQLDSNDY